MEQRFKRLVEVMEKPSLFGVLRQQQEEWRPSKEAVKEARSLIFTEKDYAETRCGIGSFSPPWLQRLARKETYLAVYCLVGLIQGMFFTYTVSVVSTLEKRFKLTSKQTGAILSGNDISQVILAMFLGYYGNYGHRPRLVGVGVLFAAASCFLAALPHLLYGPGQEALVLVNALNAHRDDPLGNSSHGMKKMEVCYSRPDDSCGGNNSDGSGGGGVFGGVVGEDSGGGAGYVGPIILFFISQFFVGISVSNFYSIGITYLDDNVNKKTYPLYYAMTLLLRILGPVLGYMVGGRCLSMWIDPDQDPNLSLRDPRWLGAWWLGFVFLGCGLTLVGSLLFLFPRRLPATLKREAKKVVRLAEKEKALEAEKGGGSVVGSRGLEYFAAMAKVKKEQADKPNLTNLRAALGRLFTNKLWLGNLFNTVVVVFALSGYWNFKPKYLENQFRRSAAEATYYTGVVSLSSVLTGTALGGIILRWVRPRPTYVAAYNVFITLVLSAGFAVLMFIGCPRLNVVGPVQGAPVPPCSSDCGCSDKFSPMCAADNVTLFYSPCFAACTKVDTFANPVVFSDCGCFDNSTKVTSPSDHASPWLPSSSASYLTTTWPSSLMSKPGEAGGGGFGVSGYCPEQCETSFYYYLITQIILKTISSTGRVGSSVLYIRSVSDEDKGLALGTLTVFLSFFAFIPAPIMMGAIIDSSCLVWDKECGRTGNCWLYDSDKFRTIIHLVPAVFIFISVFGDLVVLWYSRQMDLYGEKEDEMELKATPPTTPLTPTTDTTDVSPPPSPTTPSESQHQQQQQQPFRLLHPHPNNSSHATRQEEEERVEEKEVEEESCLIDNPV